MSGAPGDVTPVAAQKTDARPPFEKLRRISRTSALRLIRPQLTESSVSRKSISKQSSEWAAELKLKPRPKEELHHPHEELHHPHEASPRPHEASHRQHEASPRSHEASPRPHEASPRPQEETPRLRERAGSSAYRMSIIKLDTKSKTEESKMSAIQEEKTSPVAPTGVSKPPTSKMPTETQSEDDYVSDLMEFSYVNRPTTASSLKSQRWTHERSVYDREHEDNMKQFRNRPYMAHVYPEIPKHYPGTWTVVTSDQLEHIIRRLSKPTVASKLREQDIKKQQAYVRQFIMADKVKDVQYSRAQNLLKASKQR